MISVDDRFWIIAAAIFENIRNLENDHNKNRDPVNCFQLTGSLFLSFLTISG